MKPIIAITALLALTACTDISYRTDRYGYTSVVHAHDDACTARSIGYLRAPNGKRVNEWMRQTPGPCAAALNGALIGLGAGVGLSQMKPAVTTGPISPSVKVTPIPGPF